VGGMRVVGPRTLALSARVEPLRLDAEDRAPLETHHVADGAKVLLIIPRALTAVVAPPQPARVGVAQVEGSRHPSVVVINGDLRIEEGSILEQTTPP
jgi:hypothetical protein